MRSPDASAGGRCGVAHVVGGHAAEGFGGFRRILRLRDKVTPLGEGCRVTPFRHEVVVHQPFGDDDMCHRVDHGDVGAGPEGPVIGRLNVRGAYEIDTARIDDNELGALSQPPFHARREHRMRIGGIGADHHDYIGVCH